MLLFPTAYTCGGASPTSLAVLNGTTNSTWTQVAYSYTANKTNPTLIFGFDASSSTTSLWMMCLLSIPLTHQFSYLLIQVLKIQHRVLQDGLHGVQVHVAAVVEEM